jgi:hypothetical protein
MEGDCVRCQVLLLPLEQGWLVGRPAAPHMHAMGLRKTWRRVGQLTQRQTAVQAVNKGRT